MLIPLLLLGDGPVDAPPMFPPDQRPAFVAYERDLLGVPTADSLMHWHEMMCTEPHVAGTEGDARNAQRIADAFRAMGLTVETQDIWVYLCKPGPTELQIVSPELVELGVAERPLAEDKFSANGAILNGWNAYSGSGDVTGQVVYANYGTKADFARLKELGVDLAGKIVLARYGGNFRGYKAKFAEAAGAAGLIIYTDPADSGYCKGIMYPEGGYANDSCIQRGSLITLDYDGDPLTPFEPATKDAKRVDPAAVELPKIPVQPVGWGAAQQILSRMTGPGVPQGWQGGLPMAYRLTGGDSLRVRLRVEQERFIAKTTNVLGIVPGSTEPEEVVIAGAHHDAWGYGAADPCAGTITVLEAAKSFADTMARTGQRPRRSVVFAAWAAEEYGLLGSVEWVEANRQRLKQHCVAYINLDMASMGLEFGAAASPSLRAVIADAAKSVPQPGGKAGESVYDAWLARTKARYSESLPGSEDIGGGSDHVGFNCHVSIPVAGLWASGSKGTSYHSIYDNLVWYWKVVGSDYASAKMVTSVNTALLARLACAPVLPLDMERPAIDMRVYLENLSKLGIDSGFLNPPPPCRTEAAHPPHGPELPPIAAEFSGLAMLQMRYHDGAVRAKANLREALEAGRLDATGIQRINTVLMSMERAWYRQEGLPGRPWFRSLLAATDEDSGYASWMLPALRRAVEHKDKAALDEAITMYEAVLTQLTAACGQIEALTAPPPSSPIPPAADSTNDHSAPRSKPGQ